MLRRLAPILVLLLLPVIPLWRCVVYGETIGAFDQIRQMPPWNAPAPTEPWDVLMVDSVLQFYPWRELVLESWGKFEIPTWNPFELAGTPLLANSQSGALYPPHILLGVLQVPTPLAIVLLAWLHLAWAAIGVFSLCRRIGATTSGALVGGIAFGLSTFMIAWSALPSVISTCAWIPWCLWAVLGILGCGDSNFKLGVAEIESDSSTSAERLSNHERLLSIATQLILSSSCIAMMLLAGHLQFAAYGLMATCFLAVWKIVEIARSSRGGALWNALTLTVGLIAGFCLASPQILPVLENGRHSSRMAPATEEGYQSYVASAIPPIEAVSLLPNSLAYGDPTKRLSPEVPLSSFIPALAHRGANFAEFAVAVGGPVLLLAILAMSPRNTRKAALPYAVLFLLAFLVCIGSPLNRLLYFGVPNWSSTGSPARMAVLIPLCVAVMASLGSTLSKGSMRNLWVATSVTLTLLALSSIAIVAPSASLSHAELRSVADLVTNVPLIVACFLLLILTVAACRLTDQRAYFLPFIVGIGAICAGATWLVRTGQPLSSPLPNPNLNQRVAIINDQWEIVLAAPNVLLPPNIAAVLKVQELGGYDSIVNRETTTMLKEINNQDPAPPANGNMMFIKPTADPSKLADAGVTDVWSISGLEGFGRLVTNDDRIYRYKLEGPGIASSQQGPATITEMDCNGMTVTAEGPGLLTIRMRPLADLAITVNGKRRVNTGSKWIEVPLEPGENVVQVSALPRRFVAGLYLLLGAVVSLAGFYVILRFRGSKSAKLNAYNSHSTS